jgi:hypothetical protein
MKRFKEFYNENITSNNFKALKEFMRKQGSTSWEFDDLYTELIIGFKSSAAASKAVKASMDSNNEITAYGEVEVSNSKISVILNKDALKALNIHESTEYVVIHNSYSSAVSEIEKFAAKRGFEIKEDEMWNQIAIGPKKPKDGVTNKFHLSIEKDGKEQKKNLQVQITGVGTKYELNMYIL